jgi:hypothetical protein
MTCRRCAIGASWRCCFFGSAGGRRDPPPTPPLPPCRAQGFLIGFSVGFRATFPVTPARISRVSSTLSDGRRTVWPRSEAWAGTTERRWLVDGHHRRAVRPVERFWIKGGVGISDTLTTNTASQRRWGATAVALRGDSRGASPSTSGAGRFTADQQLRRERRLPPGTDTSTAPELTTDAATSNTTPTAVMSGRSAKRPASTERRPLPKPGVRASRRRAARLSTGANDTITQRAIPAPPRQWAAGLRPSAPRAPRMRRSTGALRQDRTQASRGGGSGPWRDVRTAASTISEPGRLPATPCPSGCARPSRGDGISGGEPQGARARPPPR